jgi:response regulator RpfG family c-di-GMP phosphodiesterase
MSRLAALFLKEENRPAAPESPAAEEQRKPEKYKILFVDDEIHVLKAMKRIFRQENYELLTAESGQSALTVLEKQQPVHAIISDHRMPGMTGAELLKQIKAKYPGTIRIMLTGYADVDAVMGAINEGAVYKFITKPWNDHDLRLTVSLALEQYDLIRENTSESKGDLSHIITVDDLGRKGNGK